MSPIEQAMAVYQKEACARTFDEDLRLHLEHGFVFSTPEFFIMGRPVDSKASPRLIVDPTVRFLSDRDCWHIYLMAGNCYRAWDIMPWPLPLFSFERRNELRFYPMERIRRLSLGECLTST
jgi:hypothetical protein